VGSQLKAIAYPKGHCLRKGRFDDPLDSEGPD
jgi:hypothetical protein